MADESAEGVDTDVPDAVREWLSSVAAERGVSEEELLRAMFTGGASEGGIDAREIDRIDDRFRSMIDDVRDRVIQVKREADDKAPADHTHHDLRNSVEQVGHEVTTLEAQIEQLDDRVATGFENYEEILTYLTETTDTLNRRLGRLASAVIDLREQAGEAARDEVRRTALSHLTETANRHGVEAAKCDSCGETVDLSLLVEPRCPHCDTSFTSVEPKTGFFRKSVLHTGTVPALESAEEEPAAGAGLEAIVEGADAAGESPNVGPSARSETTEEPVAVDATAEEPVAGAESADTDQTSSDDAGTVDERADGLADLEGLDGVGPAYAERLQQAGIDGLLSLAVADPEEVGEAIDVPASTVADWVEQADARTGES